MSLEKKVNRFFGRNIFIQRTKEFDNVLFTNYLGDSHYHLLKLGINRKDHSIVISTKVLKYGHAIITDLKNYSQVRSIILSSIGIHINSSSNLISIPNYKWLRNFKDLLEKLDCLGLDTIKNSIIRYDELNEKSRIEWLFNKYMNRK